MIVVVGRVYLRHVPGRRSMTPGGAAPPLEREAQLAGIAAYIALAAAETGAAVELVGSVADDPDGDAAILALDAGGVGHVALLRDPTASTPRLDAGDIDLGLRYLPDYRVLVLAESLGLDAQRVALESARYHDARVLLIVEPGEAATPEVESAATVIESPVIAARTAPPAFPGDDEGRDEDSDTARESAQRFAALVAQYAAKLDRGETDDAALDPALRATSSTGQPGKHE